MKLIDWILLFAVLGTAAGLVFGMIRNRKKGTGCCGDCSKCSSCPHEK